VPAILAILLSLGPPILAAAQGTAYGAGAPGAAPPAAADEAPATRAFRYSEYEDATIAGALSHLGLERDPAPDGKVVEAVHVVRLEVIEERDPAPRLLNAFHVLTRTEVVRREVLLRPGDVFRQALADETRRKLAAGLPQLSIVLAVAARGDASNRTHLVVVVKDVWSLRLNWDASITSGGLERLSINPSETNLLGTQQRVGLLFDWLPESYSLGANYGAPRVLGSRVAVALDAGLVFERATGSREGSFGNAQVTSPLRTSRDEWAWGVNASWLDEVTRLYSDGRVAVFALDPRTSCAATPELCVPWAWQTETAGASAFVTRSYGWAVKHDLSAGFDAQTSRYTVPDRTLRDPATVEAFEQTRVPLGEDRVGPWIGYRTYLTRFLRVLDLETFALQEDYRLGPRASLTVYPILRALGSSRDLLGLAAGVGYTIALGDGLARASVDSTSELRTEDGRVEDGSIQAGLRVVSPRTPAGRLVVDGVVVDRYANHLRRQSYLGGDARLRGYPSLFFVGSNVVAVNVELRSRPLQLLDSLQVGAVAFYDAGHAFDAWDELQLHHSAGAGVRMLFPQLDRVLFRIDLGFPIDAPGGVAPASFFATFGQAFPP
jgi:hypothetical protein